MKTMQRNEDKRCKVLLEKEWILLGMMDYEFWAIAKRSCESFGVVDYSGLDKDDKEQSQLSRMIQDVLLNHPTGKKHKTEFVWFFFGDRNHMMKKGKYEEGFFLTTLGIRACYAEMHLRDQWKLIPYTDITSVAYSCISGTEVMELQYDGGKRIRLYLNGIKDAEQFVAAIKAFILGCADK